MSDTIINKEFESNTSGPFVVTHKTDKTQGKSIALFEVEFLNTGYTTCTQKSNIQRGYVRDPFAPSICKVGHTGDTTVREDGKVKKQYTRWVNMLRRCYDESDDMYRHYGARGIEVCKRWHCFANFEEDIAVLPGWRDPEKTEIDRRDNDGDYSVDNCRWATRSQQERNK